MNFLSFRIFLWRFQSFYFVLFNLMVEIELFFSLCSAKFVTSISATKERTKQRTKERKKQKKFRKKSKNSTAFGWFHIEFIAVDVHECSVKLLDSSLFRRKKVTMEKLVGIHVVIT